MDGVYQHFNPFEGVPKHPYEGKIDQKPVFVVGANITVHKVRVITTWFFRKELPIGLPRRHVLITRTRRRAEKKKTTNGAFR